MGILEGARVLSPNDHGGRPGFPCTRQTNFSWKGIPSTEGCQEVCGLQLLLLIEISLFLHRGGMGSSESVGLPLTRLRVRVGRWQTPKHGDQVQVSSRVVSLALDSAPARGRGGTPGRRRTSSASQWGRRTTRWSSRRVGEGSAGDRRPVHLPGRSGCNVEQGSRV